jgi:hypothetical protein
MVFILKETGKWRSRKRIIASTRIICKAFYLILKPDSRKGGMFSVCLISEIGGMDGNKESRIPESSRTGGEAHPVGCQSAA